jgi:hypothetical protein
VPPGGSTGPCDAGPWRRTTRCGVARSDPSCDQQGAVQQLGRNPQLSWFMISEAMNSTWSRSCKSSTCR